MRWRKSKKIEPKENDEQIVTRFLLFPKCLNDEWRWLELAKIKQKYCVKIGGCDISSCSYFTWVDQEWAEEDIVENTIIKGGVNTKPMTPRPPPPYRIVEGDTKPTPPSVRVIKEGDMPYHTVDYNTLEQTLHEYSLNQKKPERP